MLLGPVSDGSHALLHRRILHGETLDAAVMAAALLFGAVDQVIVAAVGNGTERPGQELGMNAVAVLDELDMLLGYVVGGMKRHRPRHAIFVVHGHPRVSVERVPRVGRNEGVPGHDPLRDPATITGGSRSGSCPGTPSFLPTRGTRSTDTRGCPWTTKIAWRGR